MPSGDVSAVEELTAVLRQERQRLEQLLFRYTSLRLLVDTREVRYWGWAISDVNRARIRVRETDLVRAHRVATLDLPLAHGVATLRDIAALSPPPWSGMLRDHHDSLSSLVADIELEAHSIGQRGHEALAELASTGTLRRDMEIEAPESVLVPAAEGTAMTALRAVRLQTPGRAAELDPMSVECVVGDLIAIAGRLRIPALLAFLR